MSLAPPQHIVLDNNRTPSPSSKVSSLITSEVSFSDMQQVSMPQLSKPDGRLAGLQGLEKVIGYLHSAYEFAGLAGHVACQSYASIVSFNGLTTPGTAANNFYSLSNEGFGQAGSHFSPTNNGNHFSDAQTHSLWDLRKGESPFVQMLRKIFKGILT